MSRRQRIIVTPAGRKPYIEILYQHLLLQREAFDKWHLWLNTVDSIDLEYMRNLATENPDWIVARELTVPHNGNMSIYSFFPGASRPGTTYLRLDDDIVYLEPGFIEGIMTFREANPQPFLVYGNIVNNAITSHIFQRNGCIGYNQGITSYQCMDKVGYMSIGFAEMVHREFLSKVGTHSLEQWKYPQWRLFEYERVSINAIAWLGEEFAAFGGDVGLDEEYWLSVIKPRAMGRPNIIYGQKLCAHYAFFTQRPGLDKTDVLDMYRALSIKKRIL